MRWATVGGSLTLSGPTRERVEQFVRPLYAGLDGEETFSRVARVRSRVQRIDAGAEVDAEVLELLILFHGVIGRLGSLGRQGRLDLFLGNLGLAPSVSRRVRGGLRRLATDPRTVEEMLVHDAVLLEESGVAAAARRLMVAGRRRVPLERALARLDPGPPAVRYSTPGGAAAGAERRHGAKEWIESLRRTVAEENESPQSAIASPASDEYTNDR